jgi:transcriptional regulator GlxA family with amidase domain
MHRIAILALHTVLPYDLGIACEVFSRVRLPGGDPGYGVLVCGENDLVQAGAFDLRPPGRISDLGSADTVIVPGIDDVETPFCDAALTALRSAWESGARVASICSGAFVLGAAGLLDGKRVTTHWLAGEELARRYPLAKVEPDVLFVDEGRLVTSAGASAGLDMCLHLVRRDYGQAAAAHAARLAVAPLNRDGGQAQFIRHELPRSRASLASTLDWALANIRRPINVAVLAERAGMSERTFVRRFGEQTGSTPLQWLLWARIRRAQELLETSSLAMDEIANAAGFGSAVTFRARFRQVVGQSPAAYRARFGGACGRDVAGRAPGNGPVP